MTIESIDLNQIPQSSFVRKSRIAPELCFSCATGKPPCVAKTR